MTKTPIEDGAKILDTFLPGKSNSSTGYAVQEADSSLSYSYWLGTFIINGSVAPRVILDVLVFGVLTVAIVLFAQVTENLLQMPLSVSAGTFGTVGAILGLLVLRVNTGTVVGGKQEFYGVALSTNLAI